ncbi:MAG: SUMF1/EgtB/PvdO family nonheme iron enzyme [Clostridia bacterium]|nr:SUMF1/EgtB/PvdO family nonheme iron enzyme [Clostridia bacterium]
MDNYFIKTGNCYCAKYEVTNNLWNNIVNKAKALGYDLKKRKGSGKRPVVLVNFYDCIKFCNALNEILGIKPVYFNNGEAIRKGEFDNFSRMGSGIRLPESREWIYACSAGAKTKYFWGDELGTCDKNEYAWFYQVDSSLVPHEVGLKKPNSFGLYDMTGNVCEWCSDRYSDTPFRMLKGGSCALDSVLETEFDMYVPDNFTCIETGLRLFSDTCIDIPAEYFETCESNEDYVNRVYNIFELLNLEHPDMYEVKNLYNSGNEAAAKREYIRYLSNRIKNEDVERAWHFILQTDMKQVDLLMQPYNKSTEKWFYSKHKISGGGLRGLVESYIQTGDFRYVDEWFDRIDDYMDNYKNAFDNLDDERLKAGVSNPTIWLMTCGFFGMAVTNQMIKLFANVDFDRFTDKMIDVFVKCCVTEMTTTANLYIKDSRSTIPNQFVDVAARLLMFGYRYNTFKISDAIYKLAFQRYKKSIFDSNYLSDGGDMEQSYNYNFAMLNTYLEVENALDKNGKDIVEIEQAMINRVRFFRGIQQPYGGYPASGTTSAHYPPALYNDYDKFNEYKNNFIKVQLGRYKKFDLKKPGFTSVAFPYSGIYVLRNSYDVDGVYMWLMGARRGKGHAGENINSVAISAYGMPMIVNAGASWYGIPRMVPEDQLDIMDQIEQYKHSSFGESTGIIDNMSQGRLRDGENIVIKKYDTPIKKGFYTDDFIDYAQTEYDGIYYNSEKTINGIHKREVIFARKQGIFVIKDTFVCEGEHDFKLIFHIMPEGAETREPTPEEDIYLTAGYNYDEIRCADNKIYTIKKNAPNFEIYSLNNKVNITLHCGELNPCCGWFGGAISSRRHENTVAHIDWHGKDKSVNYTVFAPSGGIEPVVDSIANTDDGLTVKTKNGDILTVDDNKAVINNHALVFSDIKIPGGFSWKEEKDVYIPDYHE